VSADRPYRRFWAVEKLHRNAHATLARRFPCRHKEPNRQGVVLHASRRSSPNKSNKTCFSHAGTGGGGGNIDDPQVFWDGGWMAVMDKAFKKTENLK
jgi:hypothetical protein